MRFGPDRALIAPSKGCYLMSQSDMREPPRISDAQQAKAVPIEVLPPEEPRMEQSAAPAEGPPIHALSALVLVAVDSLWAAFDWAPPIWPVAIPFCFLTVFVPTFLIQRVLRKDSNGRAVTFATILAVLAAIPTPITGTPIGLGLLAWTGLGKLFSKGPSPK
jgi:hypothetical protein